MLDCAMVKVPVVDVALAPETVTMLPVIVSGKSNRPDGSNAAPVNVEPSTLPATESVWVRLAIVAQF